MTHNFVIYKRAGIIFDIILLFFFGTGLLVCRWMINYEIPVSYVGNIVCKLEVTKCFDRMKLDI